MYWKTNFHLAVWAMLAVQTVAALSTNSIGGDPVVGGLRGGICGWSSFN